MRAVLIVVVFLAIGLAVTVIASRKRLASRRREKHLAELTAENERLDYFLDKIKGNIDDPVSFFDLRDRERKGPPKRRR